MAIVLRYRGRIVELADAKTFFAAPQHPYSQLLLSAMPHTPQPVKKI